MRLGYLLAATLVGTVAIAQAQQPTPAKPATEKAATWQAGLAKVCITPKKPMPMGGYVSRTQWAPKTIHELWAKALVLQDASGQRAVLVTLDLIGIARDVSVPICAKIEKDHGIPRAAIAICSSHTHTGPVVGANLPSAGGAAYSAEAQALIDEYAKSLVDEIPKLVGAAVKDLQPATLQWGSGSATFAVNRRNNAEPKVPELRAANALQGPVDHTVPVLVVSGNDRRMRAIVGGYACHATVLTDVGWSGDWPGFGQTEIEKRHPEALAMFWAGCGADQNPLPRRTIPLAQEYGTKFADAVDQVLAGKLETLPPELKWSYEEIEIPFAKTPSREQFEKEAKGTGAAALRAKLLLKQWEQQGQIVASYPNFPVQRWKLGNSVEWIFLGGEVVVDYALRLKQAQPAGTTWVAGYSNDVMAYIPSRRVLAEGGYEGSTAMVYYGLPGDWHESIEQLIVQAVEKKRKPVAAAVEKSIAEELTRVAPLEPAAALKSFSVVPGFRVEQVAAEPLIHSPIACSFDEDGRMYVVEMCDYSEQEKEMLGKVRLLEDTDGDGRFDKSTIFAERLSWPTAVIAYDGGVFVGAAPDILYLKDTNGDGRADEQKVVFTGFGRNNVQALLNSFQWGLDGRIHGATSNNGGTIQRPDDPRFSPLVLGRRDFSFDPRKLDLRAESGGGQYGMSFDDWGHKFNCDNSTPLATLRYEDRYAARNPDFAAPGARQPSTDTVEIFRTSPVEPWRVVRTRLRVAGKVPGPIEHGGKASGYFSGATGVMAYRGNAYPAALREQIFVADPCSNIVHRKQIRVEGTDLVGKRIDEGREFVTSSDNWCRPVQFANAPDGTLYFMDMYREVIEHPWSLPPEIKQHLDLTSGRDRGRIYRIVPESFQQPALPRLGQAAVAELVKTLEHRNGWHRDTAARLLSERRNPEAVPLLEKLAGTSSLPEGRMHALYVLASLEKLQPAILLAALADPDPRVREHAVRLAEKFPNDPGVLTKLCALSRDPDLRVRCQLAFSLGEFSGAARNVALAEISKRDAEQPLIRTAVLTSLAEGSGQVLAILTQDAAFLQSAAGRATVEVLANLIGVQLREDDVRELEKGLADIATHDEAAAFAMIRGYASGRSKAKAERRRALPVSDTYRTLLGQMLERSQARVLDKNFPVTARVQATQLLGLGTFEEFRKVGVLLIDNRQPQELQLAAIETLAKFSDPAIASLLIEAWPQLSPRVRTDAVDLLFSRPAWLITLLDAIESDRIAVAEMGPARMQLLAVRKEPEIHERYLKLAQRNTVGSRAEVLKAYQPALTLPANPAQGKVYFQKICAACHRVENTGHEIGPNLAAFKARGAEAILINVLDPNREVNPQYVNYVASLDDGRTLNGMIANESAASITLKRAENATDTIQRSELEELRSTRQSMMPEGIEKQLDPQALADLIGYLLSVP
jgi:putative membrane-bound dehydrogenase-like protein